MAANAALIANNNNPLSVDYDSNPFLTNHPEAAGWAATFYLLGIGTDDGEPNYEKAWKYMQMGAPGGLKTCSQEEDRHVCDAEALNCFGLAYARGLPGILEPDPARAARYFTLAKEYGSADGQYNLAMMRLGWMNLEEDEVQPDDTENTKVDTSLQKEELVPSSARLTVKKTSKAEYSMSFNDLMRSANKGHIQSLHKAGLMYARGIGVQQHCPSAVKFLRQVSEQSPAVGQRIRRAHKAYREGNIDLALWNYLVVAEAGVELAQSNAAWLLERGHCLGLDQLRCAYASVRMWKAASKHKPLIVLHDAQKINQFYGQIICPVMETLCKFASLGFASKRQITKKCLRRNQFLDNLPTFTGKGAGFHTTLYQEVKVLSRFVGNKNEMVPRSRAELRTIGQLLQF